ncbi:hypothetical protein OIU78_012401 [Salix suchowensis]|nr:hypothetical protein OIU78_012401 [Salix suchowensis]
MSAVPKVWKRLMVTFLSIFAALLAYFAVATLVISLVFSACVIFIGFSNLKAPYSVGIVLLVLYLMGSVYLTIIWQLASAVSVLEEDCGFKAMTKSRALIKVVHGVSMNMAGRVFLGVVCSALFLGLFLFGSVTQTVIYFVCKSNHHENIDKVSPVGSP